MIITPARPQVIPDVDKRIMLPSKNSSRAFRVSQAAVASLVAVAVVAPNFACRGPSHPKWIQSERVLAIALAPNSADATDPPVSLECRGCLVESLRVNLPPLQHTRCVDTVPFRKGWALECYAKFDDGWCLYADVVEEDGAWRVETSGGLKGCP